MQIEPISSAFCILESKNMDDDKVANGERQAGHDLQPATCNLQCATRPGQLDFTIRYELTQKKSPPGGGRVWVRTHRHKAGADGWEHTF